VQRLGWPFGSWLIACPSLAGAALIGPWQTAREPFLRLLAFAPMSDDAGSNEFWEISSLQPPVEYGVQKFSSRTEAEKAWSQTGPGHRLAHIKGGVHTVIAESFSADQKPLFCCGKMAQIPERDGTSDVTCADHDVRYTVTRETTGPYRVGVGVTGQVTFRRWYG